MGEDSKEAAFPEPGRVVIGKKLALKDSCGDSRVGFGLLPDML